MKKTLVVTGLFVMLLTAGVSSASAQVSIIIAPPVYGQVVYPNYGYTFYQGHPRGCGGYNNYGYYQNQGNYGWGNGYNRGGGYGYNRGGRGGGHHHHGCR